MRREWQFDGLVGASHHYAGLATGNLASAASKGSLSNPRLAAIQSIEKMEFVASLGMKQAFLPPHYRPLISHLRQLGFGGDLAMVLEGAYRHAPELLSAVFSSSFMWAANAATVTLDVDNQEGHLHLTPANLASHYHRSLEVDGHLNNIKRIFHNKILFSIHNPIKAASDMGDEGAANHMELNYNNGINQASFFVYGKSYKKTYEMLKFMPRQAQRASEAVARLHGLDGEECLFLQQSSAAINAGVFHNDVIALSTGARMILHEQALAAPCQHKLRSWFSAHPQFRLYEVRAADLSLAEAVQTYLFNSQYLLLPTGEYVIVAPAECSSSAPVQHVLAQLVEAGMVDAVHYRDVRESMRNGGGPACLRLRVPLTPAQEEALPQAIVFTQVNREKLLAWVQQHYRDRLTFDDLRDPLFVKELEAGYEAFEQQFALPGWYDAFRGA